MSMLKEPVLKWTLLLSALVFIGFIVYKIDSVDHSSPPQTSVPTRTGSVDDDQPTGEERATCDRYGEMAGSFAVDRDSGISLREQLKAIRSKFESTVVAGELSELATNLYTEEAFRHMTKDGASKAFFLDCLTPAVRGRYGGRGYRTQQEIAGALAPFQTFNGTPLMNLARGFGLPITYAQSDPIPKDLPDHEPGDIAYTIEIRGHPSRAMPCRPRDWVTGDKLQSEFLVRGSQFPLVEPDQNDPFIYWAATGKCSSAYTLMPKADNLALTPLNSIAKRCGLAL